MSDRTSPYSRFCQHKQSAKSRGIPFLLTFEQWWELWEPHWSRRGQKALDMCMCRKADQGGYELGNVRIATNKENQHERALEFRTRHAQRRYRNPDPRKPMGAASIEWARGRHAFEEYSEDVDNV